MDFTKRAQAFFLDLSARSDICSLRPAFSLTDCVERRVLDRLTTVEVGDGLVVCLVTYGRKRCSVCLCGL